MKLYSFLLILLPLYTMADGKMNAADYKLRADSHLAAGDTLSAMSDIAEAIKLDNKMIEAYRTRAVIYSYRQNYKEALADYSKIIEYNPTDKSAYGDRAVINEMLEDFKSAESDYINDLKITPDKTLSLEGAIRMKMDYTSDYNGALPYLETLIKLFPQRSDYLFLKGQALQNMNKYPDAIEIYNKVEKNDPTLETIHFFRGMCYLNSGKKKDACADFQKAKEAGLTFADDIIKRNCE